MRKRKCLKRARSGKCLKRRASRSGKLIVARPGTPGSKRGKCLRRGRYNKCLKRDQR